MQNIQQKKTLRFLCILLALLMFPFVWTASADTSVMNGNRMETTITNPSNIKNGVYIIKNVDTGSLLTTLSWPAVSGEAACTVMDNYRNYQYWQLLSTGDGYFRLRPFANVSQYLDLYNNWDIEDNAVNTYVYTGYPAQKWRFQANGDGTFRIYSQTSTTRVLSTNFFEECIITTWANEDCQKWQLIRVSSYYAQGGNNEWNLTNLNKTYCSGYATSYSVRNRMQYEGCYLAACAMVLKNHYVKTTEKHYDSRTGTTAKMYADPYTVFLANNNFPNVTYNSSTDKYTVTTGNNPYLINSATVTNYWGMRVEIIHKTGTETEWAQLISDAVADNPAGVMARYDGHTIVIIGSTYASNTRSSNADSLYETAERILLTEENEWLYSGAYDEQVKKVVDTQANSRSAVSQNPTIDSQFTICDPGGSGNHILLTDMSSYNTRGGISNITYIQMIVPKD